MSSARRGWLWAAWLCASVGFLLAACNSSISTELEGKLCDDEGRCASGYECDTATNTCVSPVGTPACREGETVCSGKCVTLGNDPANCGGPDAYDLAQRPGHADNDDDSDGM